MKYFWDQPGKPIGLNADIERHRAERTYLEACIASAAELDNSAAVKVYLQLLTKLEVSLADLVNKLGRRNDTY